MEIQNTEYKVKAES